MPSQEATLSDTTWGARLLSSGTLGTWTGQSLESTQEIFCTLASFRINEDLRPDKFFCKRIAGTVWFLGIGDLFVRWSLSPVPGRMPVWCCTCERQRSPHRQPIDGSVSISLFIHSGSSAGEQKMRRTGGELYYHTATQITAQESMHSQNCRNNGTKVEKTSSKIPQRAEDYRRGVDPVHAKHHEREFCLMFSPL